MGAWQRGVNLHALQEDTIHCTKQESKLTIYVVQLLVEYSGFILITVSKSIIKRIMLRVNLLWKLEHNNDAKLTVNRAVTLGYVPYYLVFVASSNMKICTQIYQALPITFNRFFIF